jgi:hypothetical protein
MNWRCWHGHCRMRRARDDAGGRGAMTRVTPRQAAAERARRELARRRLAHFCQYVDAQYQVPAHVALLAERLEQVARFIETEGREGIGRLMILMPPRHGKTELASRLFPAWMLGRETGYADYPGELWR